jgi:hypothetical protein
VTSPAPVFVVATAAAVMRGDWMLAVYLAKQATLARVSALLDDRVDVDLPALPPAPEGRCVGAERCSP